MGSIRCVRIGHQKKSFLGIRFAKAEPAPYIEASLETPEAEAYVQEAVEHAAVPVNLPTVGYATFVDTQIEQEDSQELTDLENQAHAQKVLLSSDAMRYFIAKVASVEERHEVLDAIIAKARVSFPSEDGWVVLNLSRMEQLIEEVHAGEETSLEEVQFGVETSVATPINAGSLAEAIITGNLTAAYQMISHRPMVALADATSDLDALYRYRNGETVTISEMLKAESVKFTSDQLQAAIVALTSALDGTYTSEEEAVKMSIMKAVKALS